MSPLCHPALLQCCFLMTKALKLQWRSTECPWVLRQVLQAAPQVQFSTWPSHKTRAFRPLWDDLPCNGIITWGEGWELCFILNFFLLTGQPLEKSFKCHRPSLGCRWRFKGYCNNFCKDAMRHRIHFGPVKLRIAWLTFVDYNITWLQLLYNTAIYSTKQQEPINEHLLIRNEIPQQ